MKKRTFLIVCLSLALAATFYGIFTAERKRRIHEEHLLQSHLMITKVEMDLSVPALGTATLFPKMSHEDAIKICTDAIMLSPHFAHAYEVRAELYDQVGKTDLSQHDRDTAQALKAIE